MEKETSLSRDDLHPQPADGNAGKEQERERQTSKGHGRKKILPCSAFFSFCYWNKNEEYIICEAVFSVYCHQVNNSNGARRK